MVAERGSYMGATKWWTLEEIEIIKGVYPKEGCSNNLLSKLPYRTKEAIRLKARRLGLYSGNTVRKGISEVEYLELLENTNFTLLGDYINKTTLTLHECNICGHQWDTRPQAVLSPRAKCPICAKKCKKHSNEHVDKFLKARGYTRLSPYLGTLKPLKVVHDSCGREWDTIYSMIQQGSNCPACSKGFGWKSKEAFRNVKAFLYILALEINQDQFYKIGVTSRSDPYRRMNEIGYDITRNKNTTLELEPVALFSGIGEKVLNIEYKLHERYLPISAKKYVGEFAGKNECFLPTLDIEEALAIASKTLKKEVINGKKVQSGWSIR